MSFKKIIGGASIPKGVSSAEESRLLQESIAQRASIVDTSLSSKADLISGKVDPEQIGNLIDVIPSELYVAPIDGYPTSIAYSTDGQVWEVLDNTNESIPRLKRILFGNNVVVGIPFVSWWSSDPHFYYSLDNGASWNASESRLTYGNVVSAIYENGVFLATLNNGNKILRSVDGISWSEQVLPISSDWYSDIVFGDGKFLFVSAGYSTSIALYSSDGITWSQSSLPSHTHSLQRWSQVFYGGGQFLARDSRSGQYVNVSSSTDGINWSGKRTLYASGGSVYWELAYGNNVWVAINPFFSNIALYSTDSITWTQTITSPNSSPYYRSVSFFDGKFMAINESSSSSGGARAIYSTDGASWFEAEWLGDSGQILSGSSRIVSGKLSVPTATKATSKEYVDIAISTANDAVLAAVPSQEGVLSDVYIAVSRESKAAYSTDAINWTQINFPNTNTSSIVYGDDKFVAITGMNGPTAAAAYSTDGINWTTTTLPSSEYWSSVTYGNGKFVAIASFSSKAAYSVDGITWTASTLPGTVEWRWVVYRPKLYQYSDALFFAVAKGSSQAAYSTDGITWSSASMPNGSRWECVAVGLNRMVAVASGSSGTTTFAYADPYSSPGIAWTLGTMPATAGWTSIAFGNGVFVATPEYYNQVATSTNGTSWTMQAVPGNAGHYRIVYGGGKFLMISRYENVSFSSEDGVTWTQSAMPSSTGWEGLAHGLADRGETLVSRINSISRLI